MLCSEKSHSLNLEFPANEREKIDPGNDYIAAKHACGFIVDSKACAEFFKNFDREKCDLAFVVFAEIEVTIAAQAAAGEAFHFRHFHEREVARKLAVVANEIVTWRNENLPDQHGLGSEGLPNPETDFADDFPAKTLFQLAQNFGLRDLLELIV